MRKRIWKYCSIAMAVALTVTSLPIGVLAQSVGHSIVENKGLNFETETSNVNCKSIQGHVASQGECISWNAATKELTLDNVNYLQTDETSSGIALPDGAVIILADGSENVLKSSPSAVTCKGNLTIKGNGVLRVEASGEAVKAAGNVTLEGAEVSLEGLTAVEAAGTVTVNSGKVHLKSAKGNGINASAIAVNGGILEVAGSVGKKALSVAPVLSTNIKQTSDASYGWDNVQAKVVTYKSYVSVTDITGVPEAISAGQKVTLAGVVTPDNAEYKKIIWSVVDAGATGAVIADGTFKALAEGKAIIRATVKDGLAKGADFAKDFSVEVKHTPVTGLTGMPIVLALGEELTLEMVATPNNATYKDVVWSIIDAGTTGATIDNGKLKAVSEGVVRLKAIVANGVATGINYERELIVEVKHTPVKDVAGVMDKFTLGSLVTLPVTAAPDNASYRNIVWSVSDAGTAGIVVADGKMKATAEGTGKIKATVVNGLATGKNFEKEFAITVGYKPVTGVVNFNTEVSVGKTILQAIVVPEDTDNRSIVWSMSDAGVTGSVIVNGTTLDAKSAGTLKVKATIKDGLAPGVDYVKEFTIKVKPEGKFSSGDYQYEILSKKDKTVRLIGLKSGKSVTSLSVKSTVSYKDTSYKVTQIGEKAFYKNSKITKANISGNVNYISKNAFDGCSKLTEVVIGNKVKEMENSVFYNCKKLKKITIGTGLKELGSKVFYNNSSLRNLELKTNNLTKVGTNILKNCKDLKIKVPSSKVSAYTKFFNSQGQKSNVKVTK